MKACGIIAEYNPFHNGHLHQLQEAKKRTGADIVVVVLSGNFLQRGEPAIVDKWTRSKMALAGGADIIIELPVTFSTQAADYFARGAMQILQELKVDVISFGAESGASEDFTAAGRLFVENKEEIDQVFQNLDLYQKPYAARLSEAINTLIPDFPLDLTEPNNQLGFAYAKEISKVKDQMMIEVVPRVGVGYSEENLERSEKIASATAIRKALFEGKDISTYVSSKTSLLLQQIPLIHWEDYWPLLKYQVTVMSLSDLRKIYQIEEGLESRLKKHSQSSLSFKDFMNKVKTKQITWTKLQRLCLYILLQFKKDQMINEITNIKALRLLGFSKKGRTYLREIKGSFTVPLLSNINNKTSKLWDKDILAGEVYRLANERKIEKQDFTQIPLKNVDNKTRH